jgi:pimeloyl-ACP methyl ester carboxylesterase
VLPEPGIIRTLAHPDTLAAYLDRVDSAFAPYRGKPVSRPTAYVVLRSTEGFEIGTGRAPFRPEELYQLWISGCRVGSARDTYDQRTFLHLVRTMRAAIAAARASGPPVMGATTAAEGCLPRPDAANRLPVLPASATLGDNPPDVDADLRIGADGRVVDARFGSWAGRATALAQLDSIVRSWRFEPPRAGGTTVATTVGVRFRFRAADPATDPDSLDDLRIRAADDGRLYVVLGRVVGHVDRRRIASGDVRLDVVSGGPARGLPIVIVHSVGARATQWRPVFDALRSVRRVVLYDLRGHGASTEASDYTIDAHARDLIGILDSLRLARALLVGQGTGATIAAEVARRMPQRIAGLLLVAPAGDYRFGPPVEHSVLDSIRVEARASGAPTSLRRYFRVDDTLRLQDAVRDVRTTPRPALDSTIASVKLHDFVPALEAYGGPTLMLLPHFSHEGERRPPYLEEASNRGQIPSYTLGVGRWFYLTESQPVANYVEALVYTVESMRGQP